jgi:hypothetical protein
MKIKKVKRRFVPDDKKHSVSLLKQAKRALLRQEPLPQQVANYLLEVIYSVTIDEEKSAQRAFGLIGKVGAPDKTVRNTLFAVKVNEFRHSGMTRDEAFEAARPEFPGINSQGAADSAYRIGRDELAYMREVDHFLGQEVSGEDIQKMREEYRAVKN